MGKLTPTSLLGLMRRRRTTPEPDRTAPATIGVLTFEVARFFSKAAHLWHSLAESRISRLRDVTLHLEGVRKLVSDDDDFLLGLALAEITETLAALSRSVAHLGKRCSDPVLQRFDLVFADLIKSGDDLYGLEYPIRKMDRKVRKMERLAVASANLYQELEVLSELEQALRRLQGGTSSGALTDCRHRVSWQRQQVKCLREASLWGRSFDYTVRLLARCLFTIVSRVKHIFGFHNREAGHGVILSRSHSVHSSHANGLTRFSSGPLPRAGARSGPISISRAMSGQITVRSSIIRRRPSSRTKWPVSGMPFSGCIAGGNDSSVLQSCIPRDSVGFGRSNVVLEIGKGGGDDELGAYFNASTMDLSMYLFESKQRKLLNAPPSTLGAAALALHYANVIIVIEKFVACPHLIGPDARDDLYHMLPTSIRAALRARLKSYAKNLALSVYDPVLAAEWSEAVTRILEWLAPLAHNMIKWQSERNFEQQHLISSTNVLLLQTLYFANQMKTEAAITELLVGLNYIWRFGRELNAKAIYSCLSSRNYDDCLDSKG